MASRPANQSCGTCYVWIDGFCCRRAPQANGDRTTVFRQTDTNQWCVDGIDGATLVPYSQPQSGGGGGAVGSFTASAGLVTIVAEPSTTVSSKITIMPTNAAAVNLLKTYTATFLINVGIGFNMGLIGSGGGAVGTETFAYQVIG